MVMDSPQNQTVITFAIVLGCCGATYLFYQLTKQRTGKDGVPWVPGYPLVDNIFDMMPDTMLERMENHAKTFGGLFKMKMFSQKFLHISDTKLCREVLQKRPKAFVRSRVLDDMALRLNYLPYGLFHANDAVVWGKVRKTTSPAFSKQNLTAMSRHFLLEALEFVRHLDQLAQRDEDIDMVKENTGYTVRVISRVAFGSEQSDYFLGAQFYADVRTTLQVVLDAAMFPFPRWVWALTPNYRNELAAVEADKRFSAACQRVIDVKRAQHAHMSPEQRLQAHSLIDIMIRQDESRDAEVLANVKTFYLAGSDTTSMSISWAVHLLAQHPEAVSRMRAELEGQGFFHPSPPPALDQKQDRGQEQEHLPLHLHERSAQQVSEGLGALAYTQAVLKEAVRLYPAGPAIFLDYAPGEEEEPVTLSSGLVIPSDTTVIVNIWQCQLDPANFPDPKAFLPDRWLTADKQALDRMETAFMGFGAGARACPGMGLAMGEGVMALAALFWHFDVELRCPAEEVRAEFKFTLQPSKLPVRLRRRAGVPLPPACV